MLALLKKLSRTNKAAAEKAPAPAAAPRAAFESLEDRRLCSGTISSFSWGCTNSGLLLPATSTNLTGILIAL